MAESHQSEKPPRSSQESEVVRDSSEVEKPEPAPRKSGLQEDDYEVDSSDTSSNSGAIGRRFRSSSTASRAASRTRSRTRNLSTTRSMTRTISQVHDGISTRHHSVDLEQGDVDLGHAPEKATSTAAEDSDPDLVTWSGPDDQDNPKNWTYTRKWIAMFAVSIFALICPLSSSMVAPSLTQIGEDLNITDAFEQSMVLSIFVLGFAVGPLVWAPLSELYGRVVVLQLSNLIYLFFNLGCGLAQTQGQLTAFRFLAGLGGSCTLAIGGGLLSDLFSPEERGRALSIYTLMPLLGPAIGPIIGGFVSEYSTWRWSFYATTIADGFIQLVGLWYLSETYAPVLLARRRDKLIKETGNTNLHTPYDTPERTLARTFSTALTRPVRLLFTQPIVQILGLYLTFVYGLVYLVLASFPSLFSAPPPAGYGMSVSMGGLNYISLGFGFWIGSQGGGRLQDWCYARLKRKNGGPGRPEYRVPVMIPGTVLVPVGLLIYGWTGEYKTHPVGPNIGAFILGAGTVSTFQCLQGFLVDTYTRYAASAVGATTVLRSMAGFGFPLFAPAMYARLGLGWGNTMLAFLALAIGAPGPILLWHYGEKLRAKSKFAA